ncbi:MAG: thiamine/thiamine pyrophosphate ABC transporter permease ThiP [Litoreibacter sp.]
MAARVFQINGSIIGGAVVAALLIMLTLGTLSAVAWRAEIFSGLGPQDWSAVWFTAWQAAVSSILSVVLAIPVARALARRSFWGRGALITVLGAPFILPVIVAVLGLIAVFGRSGVLGQTMEWIGLEPISIYGIHGVLLAHVFFNLPLATRLILQGWLIIPSEQFRLAASLDFTSRDVFRHIEMPMLWRVVPGILMVIFLICTTSFAVALALGGGPRATTVELAIYQAFKFDFDLSKAALLGVVQFAICATAALVSLWIALPQGASGGLDRVIQRKDGSRAVDVCWILLATAFLLIPLGAITIRGIAGLPDITPELMQAAWRSVWVAVCSALVTILSALALAFAGLAWKRIELVGYLSIAASPLVIGTGLFIMTYRWIDPVLLALPVTIVVNAAMSLPFALRAISPEMAQVERDYGRLSQSLGLTTAQYLRSVVIPRLRRPIGFSAGLAAALSMGDLGVITLFADPETATLPLAMYRLMEAYRLDAAYGVALVLLGLSLMLFWIFDRGGRVNVDA